MVDEIALRLMPALQHSLLFLCLPAWLFASLCSQTLSTKGSSSFSTNVEFFFFFPSPACAIILTVLLWQKNGFTGNDPRKARPEGSPCCCTDSFHQACARCSPEPGADLAGCQ